ncbi:uncharacterized protein [Chanodichthys erythropterus]|uniref:uncharacterized protein n=1 Tax=Chanodichthys erythropterus TaxID=933992 RepID=UPI00351F42BA
MDTKKYAVVEFTEDSAVELVPTSWLEETKEGTFCYWTFGNIRQLVKNCTMPDKGKWRRCLIKKIWLRTDSYTKGVQKCRHVVETSNIETEESSTTKKKRAHKKPTRYLSETDSSSDDDSRVFPTENKTLSKPLPPKYKPFSNFQPLDNAEASPPASRLSCMAQPLQAASQLLLEEPQCSSEAATKNYRTKVLQKLQDIAETQQDILAMQRSILAAVAGTVTVTEEGGDILENGPCQTVDELNTLNTELGNKDKRTKLMNYLRSLGGTNSGAAVRKMLRKVASNNVLSAYSLKGKKGKLAFKDLIICDIIIGATQKLFRSLKAADVEDLISMVLKFAPHRHLKW